MSEGDRKRYCRLGGAYSLIFLLGGAVLLSGCTQTLRQQYLSGDDPCSSSREPIVNVGDELDQQQKQLAKQQGAAAMQGHELPTTTQVGGQVQINFGNILVNAANEAAATNQAYIKLKQQETGANAAAMLASVEGDASNDYARMRSVTRAMAALRSCRQTQIALAQSSGGSADPGRLKKLLQQQQAALNQDDELIDKVFGQYATRAQIYVDASSAAGRSSSASGGRTSRRAKPVRSSVEALRDEQHNAQVADRKQSETLHETLQNSIAGA